MSSVKLFGIILLGVFGGFILLTIIMSAVERGKSGSTADMEWEAAFQCQQYAKSMLKAPATASFLAIRSQEKRALPNNKYRVRAYVDAQNSFGALIRNHYTCEIAHQGGDRWAVTSLVFAK